METQATVNPQNQADSQRTTLADLRAWLEHDHVTTENALETAIAVYKAAKGEIDRYKEVQSEARSLIGEIFVETGQDKATTPAGKAYVTSPGVSVRYDSKALDALCASDDGIARLLEPHRTESQRAGTLTIR